MTNWLFKNAFFYMIGNEYLCEDSSLFSCFRMSFPVLELPFPVLELPFPALELPYLL